MGYTGKPSLPSYQQTTAFRRDLSFMASYATVNSMTSRNLGVVLPTALLAASSHSALLHSMRALTPHLQARPDVFILEVENDPIDIESTLMV